MAEIFPLNVHICAFELVGVCQWSWVGGHECILGAKHSQLPAECFGPMLL